MDETASEAGTLAAESSRPGAHDPYEALRFRDFRLYMAGSLIATVAAEMQSVAVGWEIYQRTRSSIDLGLVGLIQVLPVIFLALPAGQLADRLSRRKLVMATQVALSGASLGLAAVSAARGPIPWIYVCLGAAGIASAFSFPARWALLPQLVPTSAFGNAMTWQSSGWQVATVCGPAVGGLILQQARGRALPVYLVDAALGLVVLVVIAAIAEPPRQRSAEPVSMATLLAGVRFVRRTELILATITLDMFAVLLGGAVSLLPMFAEDILRVGPAGFGWLRAAPSIGAVTMAMVLAHRPPMRHAGRALLLAVAGFGLATIVFGISKSPSLSFLMLLLAGAFDNISVVVRSTLVQVLTPDAMRGRVSAVNSIFISMSNELGGFESGLAAFFFGPIISVVAGGIGSILVVVGVALAWPSVLRLGRLDRTRPGPEEVVLDARAPAG